MDYKTFLQEHPGLILLGFALWAVFIVTPVTFWIFFVLAKDVTPAVATCYVGLVSLPFAPALWNTLKDHLLRGKIKE